MRFGFLFILGDPPAWFDKRPHFFRIFFGNLPLDNSVLRTEFNFVEKIHKILRKMKNMKLEKKERKGLCDDLRSSDHRQA